MKKIIIPFVILLSGVLAFVVLKTQKPAEKEVIVTNLTALSVRAGGSTIVCEDALWLVETFSKMIDEKMEQMKPYEGIDNKTDNATLQKMAQEVYSNITPSQKQLNDWIEVVEYVLNNATLGNEAKRLEMRESVGRDYLSIYQAVQASKLGMLDVTVMNDSIKEQFCTSK